MLTLPKEILNHIINFYSIGWIDIFRLELVCKLLHSLSINEFHYTHLPYEFITKNKYYSNRPLIRYVYNLNRIYYLNVRSNMLSYNNLNHLNINDLSILDDMKHNKIEILTLFGQQHIDNYKNIFKLPNLRKIYVHNLRTRYVQDTSICKYVHENIMFNSKFKYLKCVYFDDIYIDIFKFYKIYKITDTIKYKPCRCYNNGILKCNIDIYWDGDIIPLKSCTRLILKNCNIQLPLHSNIKFLKLINSDSDCIENVVAYNINVLIINKCKYKHITLTTYLNLRYLKMYNTSLKTLNGLQYCILLEKIYIRSSNNIDTYIGIIYCDNLKIVNVTGLNRIEKYMTCHEDRLIHTYVYLKDYIDFYKYGNMEDLYNDDVFYVNYTNILIHINTYIRIYKYIENKLLI